MRCAMLRRFLAACSHNLNRTFPGDHCGTFHHVYQSKHTELKRFDTSHRGSKTPKPFQWFPLLAATVGLFSWDDNSISDDDIEDVINEMMIVPSSGSLEYKVSKMKKYMKDWDLFISRQHFLVWRKLKDDSQLYEYKVFGSYADISPKAFFNAQANIEYRSTWDKWVDQAEVVEVEQDHPDSEVIRWLTRCPYPMDYREYVYMRRLHVDSHRKVMVVINKSVDHPLCPQDPDSSIRIKDFACALIVRPKQKSFDENGFDYILSYYDDPQSMCPTYWYNWLAKTRIPDFLDQIHRAAKRLLELEDGYLAAEEEEAEQAKELSV